MVPVAQIFLKNLSAELPIEEVDRGFLRPVLAVDGEDPSPPAHERRDKAALLRSPDRLLEEPVHSLVALEVRLDEPVRVSPRNLQLLGEAE